MKTPSASLLSPSAGIGGTGFIVVGRSASLSSQIVADVREALFAKRLKPGDFLGTEKDLAARHGVSRIVARDALRTLEALGIVEIRMGKGGGARIARGNPRLFAEALAVQLDLTGVSAAEILDAESKLDDMAAYTLSSREFHLAIAEASHNRVLVVQFISLQNVSWPARNPTLTSKDARPILEVHKELAALIEMRDGAGARRLMDDHVKMIRARRVAEHLQAKRRDPSCC